MNKGGVFIISGPSGSGKDTVMTELFKKNARAAFLYFIYNAGYAPRRARG